jgi:hypothetical protein
MDGINHLVKGTKLMTILKEHADNHDKQLVLINEMVKSELKKLNTHFEGVVAEMEAKENLLLKHINSVEQRLEEKLIKSKRMTDRGILTNSEISGTRQRSLGERSSGKSGGSDGMDGVDGVDDSEGTTSHFWPYLMFFVGVLVCGVYGTRKIQALKTEDDFYGGRGRKNSKTF